MTAQRLAECRERIDGIAEQELDERADALEFVHDALRAELDDLLRRERSDAVGDT